MVNQHRVHCLVVSLAYIQLYNAIQESRGSGCLVCTLAIPLIVNSQELVLDVPLCY